MNAKSIIVCVPTIRLKEQWEKIVNKKTTKVYVVNTLATIKESCDFLILDEFHRYAKEFFRKSWENTKYKKVLGLTATIERADMLHFELLKIAPVFDTVTLDECLDNNWISNYIIHNVGINLSEKENLKYLKIESELEKNIEDILRKEALLKLQFIFDKSLEDIIEELRISLNIFETSKRYLSTGIWDSIKLGKKYFNLIKSRKELLYNSVNKIEFVKRAILHHKSDKVLTFCQTTDFADNLQKEIGDICLTVHSKMKKKECAYAIQRLKDNRTKIRVISSVKSLNEGIDIPDCNIGINAAGTSSKIDARQQLGRILRISDKKAVFYNVYIKNTQDFIWLKNRMYGIPTDKIKWINYKI